MATMLLTALGTALSAGALAQTQLKASHQWPGGKGESAAGVTTTDGKDGLAAVKQELGA